MYALPVNSSPSENGHKCNTYIAGLAIANLPRKMEFLRTHPDVAKLLPGRDFAMLCLEIMRSRFVGNETIEKTKTQLKNDRKALGEAQRQAESRANALGLELEEARKKAEEEKRENESLRHELEKTRKKSEEEKREKESLRHELEETQKKWEEEKREKESLRHELEEARKKAEEEKREKESLRHELANARRIASDASQEVQVQGCKIASLERNIAEARNSSTATEMRLNQDILSMKQTLEKAQNSIRELDSKKREAEDCLLQMNIAKRYVLRPWMFLFCSGIFFELTDTLVLQAEDQRII